MDAAALDDRIRLLTEMEKEYEGFSKAVKTVMQAAEKIHCGASTARWPA